jgi:spermidine/putrescine transport system permease protein
MVEKLKYLTLRLGHKTLLVYGILFFCFIYAPMLIVFVYSFNANPVNMMSWSGFTFDWYRSIFGLSNKLTEQALYVESTEQLTSAVMNSLIVACTTTAVATVIGTMTALAMARYRFRIKAFYRMLVFMPMIIPDIVLGLALLIYFVTIGIKLGLTTIIIGHCTFLTSYVFIVVSARLGGMDQTFEEASADLGASGFITFRRVTLPLIMPGVIGGALLAFIISMDDLVITYFVSGVDSTTLPVFIYGMLRRGVKPEINAIASLMILFSLVVASAGLYFRSRSTR